MTDQPLDSGTSGAESPDASEEALEELLGTNRSIADLEVTKLRQIVEWIAINQVDPVTHDKGILCNRAVRTSGEGSPYVTEFDLMEFAAVLGMTTESGEFYVCKVAELRYRLPKLWDAVEPGKAPAWKAIRVAECTYSLPEAGALHVDQHLILTAGSCSPTAPATRGSATQTTSSHTPGEVPRVRAMWRLCAGDIPRCRHPTCPIPDHRAPQPDHLREVGDR